MLEPMEVIQTAILAYKMLMGTLYFYKLKVFQKSYWLAIIYRSYELGEYTQLYRKNCYFQNVTYWIFFER